MEWVRGDELGCGNFATISLATFTKGGFDHFPPLMAVKSSVRDDSASLQNEKRVFDQIGSCQQIVTCFGDICTVERDGQKYYNLFLEYANGGSLADTVKSHGGSLPESDVRRYTRAMLRGLRHIHGNGFVHCDVKLANVLVFDHGDAKIADFGLAKMAGKKTAEAEPERMFEWRGTPLYMSPESVNDNEYEPPCDIWALGCAVVEMVTGKPAWNVLPDTNIYALMIRIGVGDEVPALPENMSNHGKDFLQKCFVKDPCKRWTAQMLLNHPFVAGDTPLKQAEQSSPSPSSVSPTNPFSFPEFASSATYSDQPSEDAHFRSSGALPETEMKSRIRQLVTETAPDWSVSDSWVTVR